MSEFSLKELAREVWDETAGADYHVVAKELARRIRPDDRVAALNEALVAFARQFVTGLRPALRRSPAATAQRNSARSAKVAGIRRAWPQLRATYFTKDGQKPLGECTKIDVIFIAENLDRKARENAAKAGRMRELAAALSAHKVQRVRDLPDEVLAEFLEVKAA
jgi:hypothetical protein